MKIDIPVIPPKEVDFPDYIGWYYSNILLPYPLYIITTIDEKGIPNAQPNSWGLPFGDEYAQFFLFYDWASHHTAQNIATTKEFVINIPSEKQVPQVMKTVEKYPRGVDEIHASGLTAIPSKVVNVPRVKECLAYFECKVRWYKETHHRGENDTGIIVLGEIVAASAEEDVVYGNSLEKILNMKTVYILSRNVDLEKKRITNSMTYGTIDKLKDFHKLEQKGFIEYIKSAEDHE